MFCFQKISPFLSLIIIGFVFGSMAEAEAVPLPPKGEYVRIYAYVWCNGRMCGIKDGYGNVTHVSGGRVSHKTDRDGNAVLTYNNKGFPHLPYIEDSCGNRLFFHFGWGRKLWREERDGFDVEEFFSGYSIQYQRDKGKKGEPIPYERDKEKGRPVSKIYYKGNRTDRKVEMVGVRGDGTLIEGRTIMTYHYSAEVGLYTKDEITGQETYYYSYPDPLDMYVYVNEWPGGRCWSPLPGLPPICDPPKYSYERKPLKPDSYPKRHVKNKEGRIIRKYLYDTEGLVKLVKMEEYGEGGEVISTTYYDEKGRPYYKIDKEGNVVYIMLKQNYPNPCNPETWIPYQLFEDGEVTIRIYNVAGQLVKTLNLGYKSAGMYLCRSRAAYWDGRNDVGEEVLSGVYFYHLLTGNFTDVRKLAVIR